MKKAYTKEIFRSIGGGKRRFFSILLITALGVTMLTGLRATCVDLRFTADRFFDSQHLFDVVVQSTLGLTAEDVAALSKVEGVQRAEGAWTQTVKTAIGDKKQSADVKSLSTQGINAPYVVTGRLPETDREIAVTGDYLKDSGKKIGDTLTLQKGTETASASASSNEATDIFPLTAYTITGTVIDATDVNGTGGAVNFRTSSSSDYAFFVTGGAAVSKVYTAVYLVLDGTADKACFSQSYTDQVNAVVKTIESQIKSQREQARTDGVIKEASDKVSAAEAEMNDQFDQADAKIAAAKQELADGQKQLDAGSQELDATQTALDTQTQTVKDQQAQAETQFAAAEQTLAESAQKLADGWSQWTAGQLQIQSGLSQLAAGQSELSQKQAAGQAQIDQAKATLAASQRTLDEGRTTLAANEAELDTQKADARAKIADAWKDVGKIDAAKWYVQDRSSLGSYANIQSDANSIEAVGTAFPVLFLIVAVLISLTTITRMVEEERGLIGTYKALGFTDREIRRKYLVYAFLASFLGGVLGNICGFLILPQILFSVFRTLYSLPAYALRFDPVYGLSGVALFVVAITGATAIACRVELNQTPADLMRPKSPRAGSRVFLEYLPGLWSRMSFLNKVTARNLFRYKKRLLMTILGIMGCAALMMCGFAIRDSVKELMPEQYVQTFKYDVMAVSSGDDNETLLSRFRDNPEVSDYINLQITNVKVKSASGKEQTVQLYVIPDGTSLEGYIGLRDAGGQGVTLPGDGVLVTQNASQVMGFGAGDTLSVQDLELKQADVRVAGVVRNYLGNMIYMSQKTYSAAFGKMAPNAVLAHLSTPAGSHRAFVNTLEQHDEILSASSTQANKEDMFKAFSLVNMIVTIIIVLAAGLAFVVLFTLSTTNISERGRELATIKVLGFYNPEVHLYVNKETMILTVIGIALGLPLGRYIGGLITEVLNMPSIYLAITVYPASYAITAALTLVFALAVAVITNRVLDSIDPVEALKSVE